MRCARCGRRTEQGSAIVIEGASSKSPASRSTSPTSIPVASLARRPQAYMSSSSAMLRSWYQPVCVGRSTSTATSSSSSTRGRRLGRRSAFRVTDNSG